MNKVRGKVPRWGNISPKTFNKHNLCCQYSVNKPNLLFVSLRIRNKIDEPYFSIKINNIIQRTCFKKLVLKYTGRNFNQYEQKFMIITNIPFRREGKNVTVQQKNHTNVIPLSYVVSIYLSITIRWTCIWNYFLLSIKISSNKMVNVISINDIVTFDRILENLPSTTIKPTGIYRS